MSFIITAVGGVVGGVVTGLFGNRNNQRTNDTNREIAQIPTRITGVDQLLNELSETATQQQSTALQENVNSTQRAIGSESGRESTSRNQQQNTALNETQRQLQEIQSQLATEQQSINDSNINTSNRQISESGGVSEGATDTATTRGNAQTNQALADLTTRLSSGPTDTSAAVSSLVNQILRQEQEGINDFAANSGTFDSTTERLLQNNAAVKAGEAGAALQLDESARQTEQLLAAVAAGQAGTEDISQLTTEEQRLIESLQSTQQTQQRDVGNVSGTESQTQNVDSASNTIGNTRTNVSETGATANEQRSDQIAIGNQSTNANETTTGTSTRDQTQNQSNFTDQFQNPNQNVQPVTGSTLGNIVFGGAAGGNQERSPIVGTVNFEDPNRPVQPRVTFDSNGQVIGIDDSTGISEEGVTGRPANILVGPTGPDISQLVKPAVVRDPVNDLTAIDSNIA